jgi:N-formylmaleamate deformylase
MPYVETNGISVHYARLGGQKPPLLLCHGIMDSGACWPRVAAVLSKDYDLIMLDARGHGLSDAPESGYTWQALAEDVAGVISALGLSKPGILGHSMGASTASIVAARYPDRVGFLVLEDPPWRDASTAPTLQTVVSDYRQRIVDRKTMTMEQMIEYTLKRDPGLARWDKSEFAPWSAAKNRVSLNVAELLNGASPPYQEIAAALACPTLLIAADPAHGGIVTPEVTRQAVALNPRIQVATIPDTGHNIRRESFEPYIAAVTAFVRSL